MSGYTIDIDGDVLVMEVTEELDAGEFAMAFEDLLDGVGRHAPAGVVTHVHTDDPYGVETFRHWEESALAAADSGVERWAVVAPGTKQLSLRSQVSEAPLEVSATDDVGQALDWARG